MTPLVCAVRARLALHQGDGAAARQELGRCSPAAGLADHAVPYMAVQAWIELTRVYLALADLAGAWTPLQEIDEVLKRRPGLGALAGETAALRARLGNAAAPSSPGRRR